MKQQQQQQLILPIVAHSCESLCVCVANFDAQDVTAPIFLPSLGHVKSCRATLVWCEFFIVALPCHVTILLIRSLIYLLQLLLLLLLLLLLNLKFGTNAVPMTDFPLQPVSLSIIQMSAGIFRTNGARFLPRYRCKMARKLRDTRSYSVGCR